jgi:hypothetical protein
MTEKHKPAKVPVVILRCSAGFTVVLFFFCSSETHEIRDIFKCEANT